ncbi:MAG: cytochrome c oxidase assembly protein [Hyphomicrobiaceae bacterium]
MKSNKRIAFLFGGIAIGMLGLAYAAVPLYSMFCSATGYAGTTQRARAPSQQVLNRDIIVRFDANVAPGLKWDFRPEVNSMKLKIGENALVVFKVTNRDSVPIVGSATFNVTPDQAGAYFDKVQCFCFTEQRVEPGETVDMPVSFYVDPAIVDDPDGAYINLITLSYTFHKVVNPTVKGVANTTAAPESKPGQPAAGTPRVPPKT